MKNKTVIILIALFLVFVIGGTILANVGLDEKDKLATDYELPIDHIYEPVTYEELLEIKDTEERVFVIFSDKRCPACMFGMGYINEFAPDYGIEKVYYVNYYYAEDTYLKGLYEYAGTPSFILFENGEYVINSTSSKFDDDKYNTNGDGYVSVSESITALLEEYTS